MECDWGQERWSFRATGQTFVGESDAPHLSGSARGGRVRSALGSASAAIHLGKSGGPVGLNLEGSRMRSFKHSGDMGDIIYALPTIRIVGGGNLFLSKADFTRHQPNAAYLANIGPLLECQSYIKSVQLYDGRAVAFDLDLFRFIKNDCTNIAVRHLRAFGLPESEIDRQWLFVEPKPVAPVLINVTGRYRNRNF